MIDHRFKPSFRNMRIALLFLACALVQIGSACCGRMSADIRYSAIDVSTYRFDVVVYTCLSAPFDQPEIEVSFDHAATVTIPRTSITDYLAQDIRRSEYTFDHDFVIDGTHTVDAIIGVRGAGVINIPDPSDEWVCIRAVVVVDGSLVPNNSIQFNMPPHMVNWSWNSLDHTPSPLELDGDSLVFAFGTPKGAGCADIPGYQLPEAMNFLWINPENGTFIWDYPTVFGEHNLTIIGSEYRNGQLIGQVRRDMSVCVEPFVAGLNDAGDGAPFMLHPTVTEDIVSIMNRTNGILMLEVISATGSLVKTFQASTERSTISLGHLGSGLYFIRARTLNGKILHSTRVVRQ